MTRDAPRVSDDHNGDIEVFSALWAAAPSFPQLPPDAPAELQTLSVDVKDPKRVYAIYRASRRHGFQLLVERYITQLRYGCLDVHCNISTCFTYRRRSAGSKPLRRYNATSARTLACFLASQDNPEKGLCQILRVVPSKNGSHARAGIPSKTRGSVEANRNNGFRTRTTQQRTQHHSRASINAVVFIPLKTSEIDSQGGNSRIKKDQRGLDVNETETEVRSTLEQPLKKDHKSFVQNMFGTVAFRMIEWMTPKNLEALITSESTRTQNSSPTNHEPQGADDRPSPESSSGSLDHQDISTEQHHKQKDRVSKSTPPRPAENNEALSQKQHPFPSTLDGHVESTVDDTLPRKTPNHTCSQNRRARRVDDPIPHHIPLPSTMHVNGPGSIDIKDRDLAEHTLPKNALNGQSLLPHESDVNKCLPLENQEPVSPKKARWRAPSAVSPKPVAAQEDISSHHGISPSLTLISPKHSKHGQIFMSEMDSEAKVALPTRPTQPPRRSSADAVSSEYDNVKIPQSLGCLTVEIIDLLCNILQEDIAFDSGSAYTESPYRQGGSRRLRRGESAESSRDSIVPGPISMTRLPNTGLQWRDFTEQSLFHVFSSPTDLLYSFYEHGQFLDTQTIWYCMLRLIQHFPSVVYDSLWISAEDLYIPPQDVWQFLEIPTADTIHLDAEGAGNLMSLCLHALIAAVPYVHDSTDLFTISRIRSCGISTSHGRRMSKELAELCLLYDDVFSNEMALRLACRIFASIPVRRRYQDVFILNNPAETSSPRPDVLDLVLAPLDFLNIEIPPILEFSPEERKLHEKRAPTLLIDWARAVMLREWNGLPEVPADGSFGGALAMVQAIYEKRKSLLLGGVAFRTEYFSDRLDSMEMPVEWLSFDRRLNKKTVHLLDYPYLFSPSTLVTYFRAINFSRMNRAFETSGSTFRRIQATIQSPTLITDTVRRNNLYESLEKATSKFLVLQIRRTDVLVDAFNHLWRREERELSRPLKIRLGEEGGEEGSDSGGVQQEFFRLAMAEALNPDFGTFTVDERTRMTWFQPSSPEPLWKFELIGLIVSLAIYNGLTLPVTFPKALYRKLLGQPVTDLHHIEDGWSDLANGLSTLLDWDEKDGLVEDVFTRTYEFSVDSFGHQISRDMAVSTKWPQFNETPGDNPTDARMVTSENRNDYVNDYIEWLTEISIRPQFQAFERGFFTCLDKRSLALFDHDILQSVVEGVQEIDISELRRFTRYVGWEGDASHRTMKDFWSIVRKYGSEEKKKLLEFITASDRVPVGGMRNLQFVVQRNGVGDIDGHLPTSYTCYGTLLLPEYSSKDILREKLGMALENAKGFGFA